MKKTLLLCAVLVSPSLYAWNCAHEQKLDQVLDLALTEKPEPLPASIETNSGRGATSSSDSAAGVQYRRNTAPAPVPGPMRVIRSLASWLIMVALSPDGARALVPHVLTNVNHDVNHNFGPGLDGDFANRVYPALSAKQMRRIVKSIRTWSARPAD